MENLNDNVCIFPESLRSNEGATVREIGSSGLRATSRETAGAYVKAAGIAVQPRLGTVSRGKTGQ